MGLVLHVRAFDDNYIWLVRARADAAAVAIVDPGDAEPVREFVAAQALRPVAILCTHRHWDHVDGIPDLRAQFDIPVYGPAREAVAGVTHPVREGDTIALPGFDYRFAVLDVPGHTAGHVAFVGDGDVFCGDTLFSGGCGRLFEGTPAQLYGSLRKLAALPPTTAVYCGHEYTQANLRFARAVEPENAAAVDEYAAVVESALARGRPSLPSTIDIERRINPFLRVHLPALQARLTARPPSPSGLDRKSDPEVELFARLRRWKDDFKG